MPCVAEVVNRSHKADCTDFNNIPICVDMRAADIAAKRVRHPIPTVKDITQELNNAKVFKVHSLSSGKGEMFLCSACHAFTPHVNAWKN